MAPRRAVYTALLGEYEDISEQHVARETDTPFICFTDRDDLVSDTWTIVKVELPFPFDLVRSQRYFKIRGHELLDGFDETLYIDNSVQLEVTPDVILEQWLGDADFAVSRHSWRDRVIDEFDEIVRLNYDDAARVNEQLLHYAEAYPDVMDEHPYWNGVLARRWTPEVTATMGIWFDHVLRYSRRDQLSANVAFALGPARVKAIEEDNNASPWHRWPVDVKRRASMSVITGRRTGPLLAEVARLERELAFQVRRADERDADAAEAERQAEEALGRVQMAELHLQHAEARAAEADARVAAMTSSFSWRLSRPVRAVGGRLRTIRSGGSTD
ncbi:glycosyltransferase domain-containing protein [Leifsonia aquatica]|uniref:glycosyltransferase domain-containing protein n=1 Tax=Leifsonia aquatica TaxID=144185 RepID=UPI0037FF0861